MIRAFISLLDESVFQNPKISCKTLRLFPQTLTFVFFGYVGRSMWQQGAWRVGARARFSIFFSKFSNFFFNLKKNLFLNFFLNFF
jgi:hypothetical protein